MNTVIFACIHNAGRSQMARAFCAALADPSKVEALSAGTAPGPRVHPEVVVAMREVGIDVADAVPTLLDAPMAAAATWLVTMGCGEACPHVPGPRREDWPLPDPKGASLDAVREIRDDVRRRVIAFLAREGWLRPDAVPHP